MHLLIVIKVALRSLRRTLMRSGLTALGIIIGVAAVITMVSLGNGAKAQMQSQFSKLDANQLTLGAMVPFDQWRNGMPPPIPPGGGLRIDDYEAIRSELKNYVAATPVMRYSGGGQVQANGHSNDAQVAGYDSDAFGLYSRRLVSGVSFGANDVQAAANVCVITQYLANALFPGASPLGQPVRIQDAPFVVVGVMADDSSGMMRMPGSQDTAIWIPYTSLLRRLDRDAGENMTIALRAAGPAVIGKLQQDLLGLMEKRRGNRTVQFGVNNYGNMIEAVNASMGTMTTLLALIGGISLLIGGIGIMNIMLVNVTERTREIGIRLAIGTRGRDVLRQFLIEALVLSIAGGVIGILLGMGVSRGITHFNHWPTQVTLGSVLGAFLCSAAVGIFFGYYPARQASRLDPIEALRAE